MKQRRVNGRIHRIILFVVMPILILTSWGMEWVNREIMMKQQRIARIIDRLVLYLLLPVLLLAAWAYSHAGELTDVQQIVAVAEQTATDKLRQPGVDVAVAAKIDDRVAMPACDKPLESRIHSRTASSLSVAVQCTSPQLWTLYVPVRVEREAEVLVLATNTASGTVLNAAHITLQRRDIGQLPYGYLIDSQAVIGKILKRPQQAGWVLSPNDIEAPNTIKRGDTVTLISRSGSIEVRAEGKALSDAGVEERIRVQNRSTRRVVDGRVSADGLVVVGH